MSVHGVVDIEGVGILDQELMAHAFVNSITTDNKTDGPGDATERYAYRRGGRFVNEYARVEILTKEIQRT